jgi:hypothetical protein
MPNEERPRRQATQCINSMSMKYHKYAPRRMRMGPYAISWFTAMKRLEAITMMSKKEKRRFVISSAIILQSFQQFSK